MPQPMTLDATTKEKYMQRRTFLLKSLLPALLASVAEATEIDPKPALGIIDKTNVTTLQPKAAG